MPSWRKEAALRIDVTYERQVIPNGTSISASGIGNQLYDDRKPRNFAIMRFSLSGRRDAMTHWLPFPFYAFWDNNNDSSNREMFCLSIRCKSWILLSLEIILRQRIEEYKIIEDFIFLFKGLSCSRGLRFC